MQKVAPAANRPPLRCDQSRGAPSAVAPRTKMRLWFRWVCVAAGLLWLGIAPLQAQSRAQLGPLCTTDTTPADQQIDACNKIIALKVFSGAKLATIYFWRAVGWNKKGNYAQVIADATEALRLQPGNVALYNLRGSAYFDKGEYDIAIADFDDALRIGGAERHRLSQPRQRVSPQGRLRPRHRRLRCRDPAVAE